MAWHPTWNEPIDDRPRRRFLADRGGLMPPGVKVILLVTIGVFLVDGLTNGLLTWLGALSVHSLMRLQVWRLVTYMFLHGGFAHIFWNMFIFWMIGSVLERQLGTRRFLYLYFVAGALGGLFEAGSNVVMHAEHGPFLTREGPMTFLDVQAVGASAGVAGVLVAFATLNPRAIILLFFILPIEAWLLALIYMVVEMRYLVEGLLGGWTGNVAHAAHVGGGLVGFVWMKWGHRLASALRRGGRGREVDGGSFFRRRDDRDQDELDRILAKIHREGVGSLTTREKMFLQEMGGKFRDRR